MVIKSGTVLYSCPGPAVRSTLVMMLTMAGVLVQHTVSMVKSTVITVYSNVYMGV